MAALKMKKADLLAALEAKRPTATAIDAEALAKHKVQVKEVATRRRAAMREAIKLSDRELAEGRMWEVLKNDGGASCPTSIVDRLDRAIADVQRDMRGVFTLDDHDGFRYLINLGQKSPSTVC